MTSLEMVKEFHKKFGHPVKDKPNLGDANLQCFRCCLLEEEVDELDEALLQGNIPDVLDALTDIQVVLDGAFLAFGLWKFKDKAMREVHRSNMSKLGADGKPIYRAGDGKILKGPNYRPPNWEFVLNCCEACGEPVSETNEVWKDGYHYHKLCPNLESK